MIKVYDVEMLVGRLPKAAAFFVGAAVYLSRAWSCGHALAGFSPEDDVSYRRFDYHGMGAMAGWILALLFAFPLFWLTRRILSSQRYNGAGSPYVTGRIILSSAAIALALGAPTFTQIAYLAGLPLQLTWPIMVSCVAWIITTFFVWIFFIYRSDIESLTRSLGPRATLLAIMVSMPKLFIVGSWVVRSV